MNKNTEQKLKLKIELAEKMTSVHTFEERKTLLKDHLSQLVEELDEENVINCLEHFSTLENEDVNNVNVDILEKSKKAFKLKLVNPEKTYGFSIDNYKYSETLEDALAMLEELLKKFWFFDDGDVEIVYVERKEENFIIQADNTFTLADKKYKIVSIEEGRRISVLPLEN